jgi:hypothetical protein
MPLPEIVDYLMLSVGTMVEYSKKGIPISNNRTSNQ